MLPANRLKSRAVNGYFTQVDPLNGLGAWLMTAEGEGQMAWIEDRLKLSELRGT